MKNHFEKPQLEIERASYDEFLKLWGEEKFEKLRLGQAFYNHFRLHLLNDQTPLHQLYEADGEKAVGLIYLLFQIR